MNPRILMNIAWKSWNESTFYIFYHRAPTARFGAGSARGFLPCSTSQKLGTVLVFCFSFKQSSNRKLPEIRDIALPSAGFAASLAFTWKVEVDQRGRTKTTIGQGREATCSLYLRCCFFGSAAGRSPQIETFQWVILCIVCSSIVFISCWLPKRMAGILNMTISPVLHRPFGTYK